MTAPLLELRGIAKAFGERSILDGLDIAVAPGRSLVLIGSSGCGKSVTLKCALGLLDPDAGDVLFDGASSSVEALRRRSGVLFQGGALFDSLTVWENVAFCLLYRDRMLRPQARDKAVETLAKVRLGAMVADQYPSELSGGMRKRVAVARAIVNDPDLVFFDEPTTGLDPITSDAVNDLILEQVRALGAAAVTVSHDIASIRKIADEVAMLHRGRIIWSGPVDGLDTAREPHLRQFIDGRRDGPIQPAL